MTIVVLNGSPKGGESITLQYVYFIKKSFPQHVFKTINVAQKIKKLEKDSDAFQQIIAEVETADGII